MLFDLPHILYMVISALITGATLFLAARFLKAEKHKDFVLKLSAVLTVILHFSNIYVHYFTSGNLTIENVHILPIYPCNVAMWALVITAFVKNKSSTAFRILAEATFYIGVTGGVVGIAVNANYSNTPNLADWDILKGLLSHSTMLWGCIYLLCGKYITIRVRNVLSVTIGLLALLVDGLFINALFAACGLPDPNSMYLSQAPYPALPFLNTGTIGVAGVLIAFAITALHEQIALPKEERWYAKLRKRIQNTKEIKQ